LPDELYNCTSAETVIVAKCSSNVEFFFTLPCVLLAHGFEYGYGAHEYSSSGVFEVEPRSCPGFIFRRSVLLGTTSMSRSDFRSFMEKLSRKYHGDTYHLIAKNCNHFTEEVCLQVTGKPIPGWINRMARVGKITFLFQLIISLLVLVVWHIFLHGCLFLNFFRFVL